MMKYLSKPRGLSTLLSDVEINFSSSLHFKGVENIDISLIRVNPNQPRKDFKEPQLFELAESIKIHGLIQPITVRVQGNHYELIVGERRLRACKLARLSEIPAYIRNADNEGSALMALIENIQRENLNAIEVAMSFERMIVEYQMTNEELALRIGKDRSTVNNYLRLLRLPSEIQKTIITGQISMGHAKALIALENPEIQFTILQKILKDGLSVRQVEELAKHLAKKTSYKTSQSQNLWLLEYFNTTVKSLEGNLISNVALKSEDGETGSISIEFFNQHDLERIMTHLEKVFKKSA
ncbi:ParB/RepB/Spo0J family partition protein [Emticicia sp. C21]|uniref:ParB/RepB/Spo0J family partition protein n=1 Tax=Emticicia sp. C21 TaxID=2302915 RepID=UPI000E3538C7|nr:ParB/RepB/Spo0J family partition protein [Emticicia sp. C21]RFS14564.1 ParB/RepB/Spo0J family partition protein [Emticicia sp. C21]